MPARTQVVTIEEPRIARRLFGSSQTAWVWLIARLWLGWEWLAAGSGKVFGGTITWRVWNWGDAGDPAACEFPTEWTIAPSEVSHDDGSGSGIDVRPEPEEPQTTGHTT